ncbi:translation elongation factor Ts [Patescibacteria group bacterium]|nr:translation elongation factor Ts [Patescibacteria group bacterium]
MTINIKDIKELRDKTKAPMMTCKEALEENAGDFDKAVEWLKKKGALLAAKKADRDASEGVIASYVHSNNKIGVLLELSCETDFVARNTEFKELAQEIAMQVAASNPQYVKPEDVPDKELENEREVIKEMFKKEKKPQKILDKIAEGKLNKFKEEISLTKQPLVKNPEMTVEELISEKTLKLGEKMEIKQFVRYEI